MISFKKAIFWFLIFFAGLVLSFLLLREDEKKLNTSNAVTIPFPETFQEYLSNVASGLKRDLTENPEKWHTKKDHVENAIEILENGIIDHTVILLECQIWTNDSDSNNYLKISYIDEADIVEQICYATSSNQASEYLLFTKADASEECPFPKGNMSFLVPLMCDESTKKDKPFLELIDDKWYLKLNSDIYNSLIKRRGDIILLDKNGDTLDRMEIEKL